MAQILLESVPVVSKGSAIESAENSTVLAVHRMLDQQMISQCDIGPVSDDSDVFQCGRCKKQFSSIDVFVNHKTECNSSVTQISDVPSTNVCGIPQNAVVVQKIQIPSSLANYPQSLILTETEVLQLTSADFNSNITSTAAASPTIQINPSHAVVHQPSISTQNVSAQIQQVLRQITSTNESHQPQAVELILNDKIITRPVILTSQQHGNALQSLILNISSPSQPQTIICSNSEPDNSIGPAVTECNRESSEVLNTEEQVVNEKEPSTVNIITEFHSSMVKSKKDSNESEKDSNVIKKDHKLNCAYCWKSFTKNFDLQQHIRSHTGEKPFQCIVCGRAFAQKSNVKKHMQTHKVWPDGLARTLPPLPPKSNSTSSDEVSQEMSCPDSAVDQNENNSENEKSGEFDKSSYVCPYCKCVVKSYYKLKSHMKQHDTEKVYKCIVASCGQMFNDLEPFLEHTRSHENEMTYRCHECNKNFPSLFDLGSHQLTHAVCRNMKSQSNKRYFQCSLCLNKYSTPAALDHHLATSSHTYSCSLCDKVFPCERYLRRHLQIHSEAESFTCNICSKGFRTEGYLKVHMLVHSQEKPYECAVCKAAFNRKDKLKRHMLIHEPVKRYKCPFRSRGCPKEFNRPDKLKSHIMTHSCIKPFSCKACGKSFARKAHLKDHIKQFHEHDPKLLEEVTGHLQKDTFCDSLSDLDDGKLLRCDKLISNSKRKSSNENYKAHKQKKKALSKKARAKELLDIADENSKDMDIVSHLTDDIPTAHIEIISANGALVSGTDLTHLSLTSGITYGDLQFDSNVDSDDVPPGSPEKVEAIDNPNSLLTDELQPITGIGDFS